MGQASLLRRILTNVISFMGKRGCGMRTVLFRGCLLALTLTAVLATSVSAQVDTGTISGTIKDESGGVLPGATVTITHEGQALTLTGVTRRDGTYIFTPIRTGAYSVEVDFPGFRKGLRKG